MGLQTWWLENRLRRIETKLKSLRSRQRHLREDEDEVARQRKRGGGPDLEQRERKLHAERERVTREINDLVAQEQRLKQELHEARGEAAAAG